MLELPKLGRYHPIGHPVVHRNVQLILCESLRNNGGCATRAPIPPQDLLVRLIGLPIRVYRTYERGRIADLPTQIGGHQVQADLIGEQGWLNMGGLPLFKRSPPQTLPLGRAKEISISVFP
jgi:hypothetical protein